MERLYRRVCLKEGDCLDAWEDLLYESCDDTSLCLMRSCLVLDIRTPSLYGRDWSYISDLEGVYRDFDVGKGVYNHQRSVELMLRVP